MIRTGPKLVLGAAAIGLAILYLGISGTRASWVYYLSVDEYTTRPQAQERRTRVHGVVAETAEVDPVGFSARFDLLGEASVVPVEYHGTVPDLFAPGREVVIEGRTDARGVFVADVLLTKCGSKYEPAGPGR